MQKWSYMVPGKLATFEPVQVSNSQSRTEKFVKWQSGDVLFLVEL